MVVNSESLKLVGFLIFDDGDSLVAGNTIMEGGGRGFDLHGTVRNDLGCVPSVLFIPVDGEHVVCELLAEPELPRHSRFHFLHFSAFNCQVLSAEGLFDG